MKVEHLLSSVREIIEYFAFSTSMFHWVDHFFQLSSALMCGTHPIVIADDGCSRLVVHVC